MTKKLSLQAINVCAVALLAYALILVKQVLLTLVIALIVAVIFQPMKEIIQKKLKINSTLSTLLLYALALSSVISIIFLFGHFYLDQFKSFIQDGPKFINNAQNFIKELSSEYEILAKVIQSSQENLKIQTYIVNVLKALRFSLESLVSSALALVIAFYLNINSKFYIEKLTSIFTDKNKELVKKFLFESSQVIKGWAQAQFIDALFVFILTSIGLFCIGFEYWLVIGVVSTVLCFIPYIGIFIATFLASVLALTVNPAQITWIVVIFFITQQIEGNFILPRLMKERINLPEVPLILFIACMGTWFGILGVLIAPPTLGVALKVISIISDANKQSSKQQLS